MDIYFHIGYPKCGSTTLQKNLFNLNHEIVNVGLFPMSNLGIDYISVGQDSPNFCNDDDLKYFYRYLLDQSFHDFNSDYAKNMALSIINKYYRNGSPLVFSHEGILSTRFSHPDIFLKISRIRAVFEEVKLIIIIREQNKVLASLYRDHPYDPRTLQYKKRYVSFHEFVKIDETNPYFSHHNSLDYLRVVDYAIKLFTPNNVLVLPIELLQVNSKAFCNELSDFLAISRGSTIKCLINSESQNIGSSYWNFQYRKIVCFIKPVMLYLFPKYAINSLRLINNQIMFVLNKFGKTYAILNNKKKSNTSLLRYHAKNAVLSKRINIDLAALWTPNYDK